LPEYTARVFIGSSKQAKLVVTAVKAMLGEQAELVEGLRLDVQGWTTTFGIGITTYASVLEASRSYDFGIFVFAPDDKIIGQDGARAVTRDNVIYELGLFTGALGEDRVFVMAPANVKVQIPSDLHGVTVAEYKVLEPAQRTDLNHLRGAVEGASFSILSMMLNVLAREGGRADVSRGRADAGSNKSEDLLSLELEVDLRRGELVQLAAADLRYGLAVIHHKHGQGIVDAWDAVEDSDILVRAQFGGRGQVVFARELFLPYRVRRQPLAYLRRKNA
jgi:hypothetical protein